MNAIAGPVDRTSSSQAKIALFRSLFRGRDDIYPRRFESRKTGKSGYAPDNSVFLDDDFVPWTDQWAFLASVRRMGRAQIERIVGEAERRGRILGVRLPPQDDGDDEPWTAPPSRHRKEAPIVGDLPPAVELVLGDQIYVAKEGLNPSLRNRLLRLAAFQNP